MDSRLPLWLDAFVIPILNLLLALLISGLLLLTIDVNPFEAARVLVARAFFHPTGLGYTLFYATNLIFTGLAVAVAFHAAMFNIGGEGQAMIAGLGVAFAALLLDQTYWLISLPAAMLLSMIFGAAWAFIPAWLQAKRGSHIVITTIMMNFVAAAVVGYLVIYVLKDNVAGSNETRRFLEGGQIPRAYDMLALVGIKYPKSIPLNIMFPIGILAAIFVYFLIWRTRLGYEIRAFGLSNSAAEYAGIRPVKIILISMIISGALAGLMANNTVLGEQVKLGLNPVNGAGFLGIAVALMGRSHPFGIVLAAILFGALSEGGSELNYQLGVSKDMVFLMNGLVILFVGALDNILRMPITKWWVMREID